LATACGSHPPPRHLRSLMANATAIWIFISIMLLICFYFLFFICIADVSFSLAPCIDVILSYGGDFCNQISFFLFDGS
jgi:hypothetical protein